MKTQMIIGCLWIQTKLTFSQNQHSGPAAYYLYEERVATDRQGIFIVVIFGNCKKRSRL